MEKACPMKISLPGNQRGFAAVLLILLAGLGITAAVLSTSYFVRGTQEQHLATHTATQAQLRAWNAVEVIRQYFSTLNATAASNLPSGPLSISGLPGVTATVHSNSTSAAGQRITINVAGSGAGATALIQVVYNVPTTSASPNTINSPNAINIRKNLDLTGSISVVSTTSNANFNVEGTVTLSGSVEGINKLCATDNVSISSSVSVTTVCTNGNLTLSGSASVTDAKVVGDVLLNGGSTSIGTILSNGNVTLNGGSSHATAVATTGNVTVTGNGRADSITAEGDINWSGSNTAQSISANGDVIYAGGNSSTDINTLGDVTLKDNGNVNNINTKGNTTINSGYGLGVQGSLQGEGSFTWRNNIKVNAGTVGGAISPAIPPSSWPNWAWVPPINVVQAAGHIVNVAAVDVPSIDSFVYPVLTIDVYPLKSEANYVFEIDAGGRRKVTIKNVHDIPDGSYFLGDYAHDGRGYKDFLCTELKTNNKDCQTPATPWKTICEGYSTSNGCLTYASGTTLWTLAGTSLAPGVAWFEGNLKLSNGKYVNTFLASGNISTGGNMEVYSLNYAGYSAICNNDRSAYGLSNNPDFANIYPTNYCNTTTQQFVSNTLGNAALIAGGYKDGVFVGGTVDLGASNKIYGNILAGDIVSTTGSTTIYGQVTAGGQNTSTTSTTWRGSTRIEIPSNVPTYNPGALPCMANCPSSSNQSTVLWSRYR